jgi:hypothetical protein
MAVFLVALLPLGALGDDSATLVAEAAAMDQFVERHPSAGEAAVARMFEGLAGSAENAGRLVYGLRNGYDFELVWVDLAGQPVSTPIYPVTGRMGLGSVFVSLALTQQSLVQSGVVAPTPLDLDAALHGGEVTAGHTTVRLRGVLSQRVDGAGWGTIARSTGASLGSVVIAIRLANARLQQGIDGGRLVASTPQGSLRQELGTRVERGESMDRQSRPERPDRPERPARPERPDRPERGAKAK